MRVEIYIEDAEAPQVGAAVAFRFFDGFTPTSPAHQLAQIIQGQLDKLAADGVLQPVAEPSPTLADTSDASSEQPVAHE